MTVFVPRSGVCDDLAGPWGGLGRAYTPEATEKGTASYRTPSGDGESSKDWCVLTQLAIPRPWEPHRGWGSRGVATPRREKAEGLEGESW